MTIRGTLRGMMRGSWRGTFRWTLKKRKMRPQQKRRPLRKDGKDGRMITGKNGRMITGKNGRTITTTTMLWLRTKRKGLRRSTHLKWRPPPAQLRPRIDLRAEKNFPCPLPLKPRLPSEASTKTVSLNDIVPGFKSL
jgi:hypothetical protein